MKFKLFAVVENPGQDDQRIVDRHTRYLSAAEAVDKYRKKSPDVGFDVMRVLEDGTLTTEI